MISFILLLTISSACAFAKIRAFSTFVSAKGTSTFVAQVSAKFILYSTLLVNKMVLQAVKLEDLPYGYNALEPYISEKTLHVHHDKHHAKYVDTTNDLIKGTELENADVEAIIRASFGKNQALFNNAGQSFNHEFYWKSMQPNGGGKPTGKIGELIDQSFGSYDEFRQKFTNAAVTAFGSGWAWLVWTPQGLKVSLHHLLYPPFPVP